MTWHHHFFDITMFSQWSKFHVNIKTGSGVMTIFVYKGLIRNLKIINTLVWVLPKIWRLGQFRDTKFGVPVSSKKLLNVAKCQGCSIYHFWVTKGKPKVCKIMPPPPKIRIKNGCIFVLKRKHFLLFINCMVDKSYFLSHIYVIY